MSANSLYALMSRSFVKVSDVWCGVDVFILFLALRFSEMLGVPPPMWFGCVDVFMLFFSLA